MILVLGLLLLLATLAPKCEASSVPSWLETVFYVPGNEKAHAMDLYIPDNGKKPLPVILWIHGGSWSFGAKEDVPAPYFLKSGFAIASINYRFTDEAIFPAQLDDCKAAVRWLRAHATAYGLDPKRIGAFGSSSGGQLVSLLGTTGGIPSAEGKLGDLTQSSKVQAVCDWYGPSDLLTITEQANRGNTLKLKSPQGPVAKLLGGLPADRKELAYQASPVNFVSADNPPFLIMHGDADNVVPIEQSSELYKALKDAHVKVEYKVVPGGGHPFVSEAQLEPVIDFFKRTLH